RRRGPTAPRARAVGGGPGSRRRSGSPASRSPGRGQRPRWSIIPHVVVLAYDGLLGEAAALAPNFRAAEPFPHAVIDGLFDDEKLSRAVDAFPAPDAMAWYQYDNPLERKLAMPHIQSLAPELRTVFYELHSPRFIRFV